MKRLAEDYLSEWRLRPDRKPLVLRGARQVGKTYLVENWGKVTFKDVIKLDLERERDLHPLFDQPDPHKLSVSVQLLSLPLFLAGQTHRLAHEFCQN